MGTGFPSDLATNKSTSRIRVGRILGPHGVRGLVKLLAFLEDPQAIARLPDLADGAGRPVRIGIEGASGTALIARIAGVESREAAEALARTELFVPRTALPETGEGEFYEADLVGLAVVAEDGERLGTVTALADFGAGPLIEVKPEAGGATVFLPFTDAVVPTVDLEGGALRVALSPGLWPGR